MLGQGFKEGLFGDEIIDEDRRGGVFTIGRAEPVHIILAQQMLMEEVFQYAILTFQVQPRFLSPGSRKAQLY